MSRTPIYTHHLTERGDLVRAEIAPDAYTEIPKARPVKTDDYITPPPSPPKFPPPPPPSELRVIQQPKQAAPQKQQPIPAKTPAKQINGGTPTGQNPTAKSTASPVTTSPPLKLYAGVDVKALEKNPMHSDIMNAAEKFKGRRDMYSADTASISSQKGETMSGGGAKHDPVYDPEDMRKRRQHSSLVVNSEMKWSQSKPLEKRNTYKVTPNSQTATYIANVQDEMKTQPKRSANVAEGLRYTKIENVPDADALLDMIATHDEKGKALPDWKRKLMARNYRVKLCKQFES